MNRRDFLKRGAMVLGAVSVAPVAILAAQEFAIGGIVDQNPADAFAMLHPGESILPTKIAEAMRDYYSIQWPVSSRRWEFGTFIGDGLMEHKVFFENGSHTAYIPPAMEKHFRSKNLEAFCQYVDEQGIRTPPAKLFAYDIDVLKHDTSRPSHDA